MTLDLSEFTALKMHLLNTHSQQNGREIMSHFVTVSKREDEAAVGPRNLLWLILSR